MLFSGDYHGSFDEVLVKAVGNHRSMPVAPGIPRESVANMLVLEYGAPESLEIIRQRAEEIAAVLVEPVQSRHPELQPVEFLRELRRITEQSGSALIFDEVVTGFRTHPGGMQAIFGIRADLATYGKVVAGGLPIGVLAGSSTYMDALDGGQWQFGDDSFPEVGVTFYAGTFMRHPLAMAAVKASLEHLKSAGPSCSRRWPEEHPPWSPTSAPCSRSFPIQLAHRNLLFLVLLQGSRRAAPGAASSLQSARQGRACPGGLPLLPDDRA